MWKCLKLLVSAKYGATLGNGQTFALSLHEKKGIVLFALNAVYSRLHPLLHHIRSLLLLKQDQLYPAHSNIHNLAHQHEISHQYQRSLIQCLVRQIVLRNRHSALSELIAFSSTENLPTKLSFF